MTKPRFVVDPVPDLTGLDRDQQLEAFMAWTQRQLDRAHDWWPKDFEERVQELEKLNARLKGEWPIPVTIGFNADAAIAQQQTEEKILMTTLTATVLSDDYDGFDGAPSSGVTGATALYGCSSDGEGNLLLEDAYSVFRSTDGTTWTQVTGASLGFQSGQTLLGVGYSDGKWVVIGRPNGYTDGIRVMTSTDAVTWSNAYNDTTSKTSTGPRAAATDGDGNWIISGYDSSDGKTYVYYSTDNGSTWNKTTQIPNATSASSRGTRARYAGNTWFILGVQNRIWYSSDQTTYYMVYDDVSSSEEAIDLAYGDGRWVCVQNSASPELVTSDNVFTWTNRGAFMNAGVASLIYHPTLKWACASGASFKKSTDGATWSDVSGTYGSIQGITQIIRETQ